MRMITLLADSSSNQATIVAVSILVVIAVITIVAMRTFRAADFLKFWSVLGPLIGLVTGSMGSYFFARPQIQAAQEQATTARAEAQTANQRSRRIATLSQEAGLEHLATLPTTQAAAVLRSANLNAAATQPAAWKAKIQLMHQLANEAAEAKVK